MTVPRKTINQTIQKSNVQQMTAPMTTKALRDFKIPQKKLYAPPPLSLSLSLLLPLYYILLPVLAQLSFLFIRDKEFCLVLSHLAVNWNLMLLLPQAYSSSLPFLLLPSHFAPLPFLPLSMCSSNLEGICVGNLCTRCAGHFMEKSKGTLQGIMASMS